MTSDVVSYLNPRNFYSKLREQIVSAKMAKMPPLQWVAYLKGLNSKGIKQVEIDDVKILPWLNESKEKSITKDELLSAFDRRSVTVKEVQLGRPEYQYHSHHQAGDTYKELLYIANSEAANVIDRIDEIDFQMEELAFDQDKLLESPGLATKLEAERRELMTFKPLAYDFEAPHFSQTIKGKHGKNVLFHVRVVISQKPDGSRLFFIDEIQSDWGQAGRVRKSQKDFHRARGEPVPAWNPHVVPGPWVSDTKFWAGLAVRRILQVAAATPGVNEVAWIRLCMRNGGMTDPREIDARNALNSQAQGADPEDDEVETDHFYRRLIPGLAETALGKSGVKVTYDNVVQLKGKQFGNLPGFVMTDAARAVLSEKQPLYSAAHVLRNPPAIPNERLQELILRGRSMLGSAARIRFVSSLLDFQDMSYKSGSYMNRLATIALNSSDLQMALDHEAYHCAEELFMSQSERNAMNIAFRSSSELTSRVRTVLQERGQHQAASQCANPQEAAAHAFALWNAGYLPLSETSHKEVSGLFGSIKKVFVDVVSWITRESLDKRISTPEKMFLALRDGILFERHAEQEQFREQDAASESGSNQASFGAAVPSP